MKFILYPFLFLLSLALLCCSEEKTPQHTTAIKADTTIRKDTVIYETIRDSIVIYDSLAGEPFVIPHFNIRLSQVLHILPAKVTVEEYTEPNPSDPDYIDDIHMIRFGESQLEYRGDTTNGMISYAYIVEHSVILNRGIKIGDDYASVVSKLDMGKNTSKTYDKIQINYGEANCTLILEFKKAQLFKIIYYPYLG